MLWPDKSKYLASWIKKAQKSVAAIRLGSLKDEYPTDSKTWRRKCDGMEMFSSKGVGKIVTINGKMTVTKGLEYEIDTACKYVSLLDRGGLKWPTKYTLEILVESYQIFNKLIRKGFEEKFLKANNDKQLLEHLVFEKNGIAICCS
ncbi:hypothetical protein AVEN_125301-1 [Araneus ventricosus]|uniref:Uncharacterized protein n=1 Tax=Araneus ventricosus TaxID=182803 RepID=A0A4Y2EMU6_ARAVE|nr:hypothetical protein AVEN_125301-1 [Araneus ventricosus]